MRRRYSRFLACPLIAIVVQLSMMMPADLRAEEQAAKSGEFVFNAATTGIALAPGFQANAGSAEIAAELASILKRVSGQEIKVGEGDSQGIVLAVAADFPELAQEMGLKPDDHFGREDYVIRSYGDRLLLVGATPAGTRLAVADLLHRWGYRQFFPGQSWEILPPAENLKLTINEAQRPAYYLRDIFTVNFLPGEEDAFKRWSWLNRLGNGFQLNTRHAYSAIYKRNLGAFEGNLDYFASVDGEPQDATKKKFKFNAANPDLLKLLVDDAKKVLASDEAADSISMEPSDFGAWDNSGEAHKKIGSPSNQAVTMANVVAKEAAAPMNKYVGIYAYYDHQFPPDISVEPNVIVSFATRFLKPDRNLYESIQSWKDKGVTMVGVRDYHSFWEWDFAMPARALGGNISYLEQSIPHFYGLGARFYTSESQSTWGGYGLGYYLSTRLLWNPKEDPQAIVQDFLEKSFGPAAEPMARFYSLLNGDDSVIARYSTPAQYYAPLLEALKAAGDRADVQQRIKELIAYVRYVELMGDMERAREDQKEQAFHEIYEWVLRAAPMQMLPTKAIALRVNSGMNRAYKRYPLPSTAQITKMQEQAASNPVTTEELLKFAQAAVDQKAPTSPQLRLVDQPLASPWLRNASNFVFPMKADETVTARLSMRRFGFSEYPRYVITNPKGEIVFRGQLKGEQDSVQITSTEAGDYSLIAEYTPNLLKCESDRVFYLQPTSDFANIEAVSFKGSFYFTLPEGVSSQVVAGGQGDHEKVNIKLIGPRGVLGSAEDVSGNQPFIDNLKEASTASAYQLRFLKPSNGAFEDVFFKFNGNFAGPVSLIPDAAATPKQANN